LKKPVKSALRRTVLVEVRETLRKSLESELFPEKPEVVIEEYKEGMKRRHSCSDIGSVKSEASKTKSVEVADAKDSDATVEETKPEPVLSQFH
jgi:hypothetical protein